MITFLCLVQLCFAANKIILSTNQSFTTDCAKEKYILSTENGALLRLGDNETIAGNQCYADAQWHLNVNFNKSVQVCDPEGEDILVIRSLWGYRYYHFIADECIRYIRSVPFNTFQPRFVHTSGWDYGNAQDCQYEWLRLMGLSPEIKIGDYLPAKIRNVMVAPGIKSCGTVGESQIVQQIRESARARYGMADSDSNSACKIVWFYRNINGIRTMNAETERGTIDLMRTLIDRIFELENCSCQILGENEKVANIYRALNDKTVKHLFLAGVHGAGFTNMLLAPRGSFVLEIHPHRYLMEKPYQDVFSNLALDCGHFYSTAIALATGPATAFEHGHLTVSSTALEASITSLKYQMSISVKI